MGPDGRRTYTLKKVLHGEVTKSAHPARFSPDDKWSRQRVTLKRRFGLLLTQQSEFFPPPIFLVLMAWRGVARDDGWSGLECRRLTMDGIAENKVAETQ